MQSTKTLGQIIDKIVENQSTRLRGARRTRKVVGRSDVVRTVARRVDAERSTSISRRERLAFDNAEIAPPPKRATKKSAAFKRFEPLEKSSESTGLKRLQTDADSPDLNESPTSEARFGDELRAKTPRRRQIDPTTCERDYSTEEVEFMKALDEYKRTSGRMFPTCSEILEVFKSLGYVKIAPTSEKTRENRVPKTRRTSTPAFLSDENDDSADEERCLNDLCKTKDFF